MNLEKITPVILSGGSGKRLWPLSSEEKPKQFLDLGFERNLFQMTFNRIRSCNLGKPIVVYNSAQQTLVKRNLKSLNIDDYVSVIEPLQRNTGPAITAAALLTDKDAILLIMPSDHIMHDVETFMRSIEHAYKYATEGFIVTFGVTPNNPHTGYGYIERGNEISNGAFNIIKFHEKPELDDAKTYVNKKNFYWNSGIFYFSASTYLSELEKYNSALITKVNAAIASAHNENNHIYLSQKSYEDCENISIDYAIMEKTDKAVVIPFNAGWTDIGNWASLWQASEKDKDKNFLHGNITARYSSGNIIIGKNKPIHALGVDNLIIIETNDGILVANKDMAEAIKDFADIDD